MASGSTSEKRPHVQTKRMREFMEMKNNRESDSGIRLLRCPEEGCDKVLTSTPGLRYHIQTHHSDGRSYMCPRCDKQFKSLNGLKYHQEKAFCEGLHEFPGRFTLQNEVSSSSFCGPSQEAAPSFHRQASLPEGSNKSKSTLNQDDRQQEDWLTQLAIIATSPQSPLMRDEPPSFEEYSVPYKSDRCMHSYAKPPPRSRSVSPPSLIRPHQIERRSHRLSDCSEEYDNRVSSSSPFPMNTDLVEDVREDWSHTWPTAVWQCFIKGSRIRFMSGPRTDWQLAEHLALRESLTVQASQRTDENCYAPNGLHCLHIEEVSTGSSAGEECLRLRFGSNVNGQSEIITECSLDHPFFVKSKGWCSFHPSLTAKHYGIPCSELEVNDLCLPPSHPDATFTVDVFESFKSYDFTPMDSSAVFALSSMAKQRRERDSVELSPRSIPRSPTKKRSGKSDPSKAKRPMNAFMLFAKKFRMEYTQLYPGKDNRAISVLLGDKWKKLTNEERRLYAIEAKQLAEQHKRIHPDCWKRKRTFSSPAVL